MNRVETTKRRKTSGPAGTLTAVMGLMLVTGCDFSVTNPGPVQDEQLNVPAAQLALVNGAGRALSAALAWVAYTSGAAALELQGSGNITNHGVTLKQRAGDLAPDNGETDEHWQRAHTARWVAEESVRRMQEAVGDQFNSSALAAQALLHVGYSNRLLGENMCVAVINGGAAQPRAVHFDRAKAAFTQAMEIAQRADQPNLALAARAGRASVNASLGDWAGAAADAAGIPRSFVYNAIYSDIEIDQYNRIFWAGASQPFRAATVYSTFFADYYTNTQDPRTPWDRLEGFPTGDGSTIPFYRQRKYTDRTDPIRLSSGREMQLIIAESQLRSGAWQEALQIMNSLRADVDLPPLQASGPTEVWNHLRLERAAELWLEGRALWDVSRWEEDAVPGTHFQDLSGRDRCFPIGITEINTNPNISGELG